MGQKSLSTRRVTAQSTVSQQAVVINTGTGNISVSGSKVTANTTISLDVVTSGSSSNVTVVSAPTITSYTVTDASYVNLDDTAVNTAGGYIKINGSGFTNSNLAVYFNNALVSNTYVSTTEVRAVIPAVAAGTYSLMVFNGNIGAIYSSVVTSGFPTWTATSYTNYGLNVSVQLLATGDTPLTYSLYSGTLPSGLSLSSSGLISGTATGDSVTSNLVFLVNDAQNQTTQQTVTLTINSIDTYWNSTVLLLNGESTSAFDDVSSLNTFPTVNGDSRAAGKSPFTSPTATDGSVYFDGTGDYLSYPDSASLRIGTSDFTIEGWFYATTIGASQRGIIAKGPNAATTGWEIRINGASGGALAMTYTSTVLTGSTVIATNTWYHFALVRSGTASGNVKLYLNGVLEGTSATARNDDFSQTDNMYIGYTRQVSSPQPFLGYISNVRVTKQALYTGAFTPSTSKLTTTSQGATAGNVVYLGCQTNISYDNNKVIDSSTLDIAVVRNSTVSQGTFTPVGSNWAGAFNLSSSDYLSYADNALFRLGSGDFTIECWVYLTSSAAINTCISKGGSTTDWALFFPATTPRLAWGIGTTNYFDTTGPTLNLFTWYHVAVVRSGTTITTYLNGVTGSTLTNNSTNFTSTGEFRIGRGRDSSANYFTGYISNVRVTKGQALYTADFTPSTTPLTTTSQGATAANISVLTCQSYQFKDNSSNALALTRNGSPAVVKFSPFGGADAYSETTYGASYGFNGTSDFLSIASNANLAWGAGDFTVETWVYVNAASIPANAAVWDQRNGTNGTAVIAPTFNLDSSLGYSFYTRAVTRFSSGSAAVKLKEWQHLTICRSSGVTRGFLDGVAMSSTYTDSDNYPAGSLNIGRANDGVSTRFWPGFFYNMRLVVGTALYTAAFTPSTTPLTAISNTKLLLTGTMGGVKDNTMLNTITTSGSSSVSNVQEKFGNNSYFFDGTGDYLTAVSNPNDNFGFLTGDFTIEGWLYTTTVAAGKRTICATRTSASDTTSGRFSLYVNAAALEFYSGSAAVVSAGTVVVNTWTHFAVTRNSGSVRIFLGGTQVGSTTSYTTSMPSSLNMTIGDNAAGTESWNGYIDELRVTKGYARYVANFSAPTSAHLLF
jgi:hypothetical protein